MAFMLETYSSASNVILVRLVNAVSIGELRQTATQLAAQLDRAPTPQHIVFDMSGVYRMPEELMRHLHEFGRMRLATHPNTAMCIAVGADALTQVIIHIFSKLYKMVHVVETLDDAALLIGAQEGCQVE